MKTLQNNIYNSSQFVVNKKQISKKNKTLKTSILYDKIESSVNSSLIRYQNSSNLSFKSIEFDILNNAYLNDKLIIKNNIKKLSTTELVLDITVSKKEENKKDIICKATFGYALKKAS
ncbi:hypothetical protein WH52_06215 [Tenacibaculum holothuriorum]|uniref:Uncharacterized protein n=1 Tax=Tenacibaculum holothuriorum TaxID=1635173 RepID=A0A1Y2PCZ6_9FLAO|nr:hypothetical protein [Tenacibaculum holothuriorum]OSY88354.1 hypothetical protein WH52_06215 [Tenacibaculum holothuriorum]